ncbi:hypothetical protein ACVHYJ_03580 [Burkholderia pyrrocinia]
MNILPCFFEMKVARQLNEGRGGAATGAASVSSPVASGGVVRASAGYIRA